MSHAGAQSAVCPRRIPSLILPHCPATAGMPAGARRSGIISGTAAHATAPTCCVARPRTEPPLATRTSTTSSTREATTHAVHPEPLCIFLQPGHSRMPCGLRRMAVWCCMHQQAPFVKQQVMGWPMMSSCRTTRPPVTPRNPAASIPYGNLHFDAVCHEHRAVMASMPRHRALLHELLDPRDADDHTNWFP